MRYELVIGWRYLYGGRRDRRMLVVAALGVLAALAGGVALAIGVNAGGAILAIGLVVAAVAGLLALFSVFTTVSVLGVALGVAALTIVLSVTSGFQDKFRDKILGVNAHVVVTKAQNTFAEYRDVMRTARAIDREVVSAQPFIFAEMLVTRGKGELAGVAIKGVDPALVRGVLDLDQYMIPPATIDVLAASRDPGAVPPIIVGRELAVKLKAKVGDTITVVVPLSNLATDDSGVRRSTAPRSKVFRVAGLFYSGFGEYDRRLLYAALTDVQELVGRGDQVMGVELKVKDLDRAGEIGDALDRALGGPPYQVQDWYDMNHNMFAALNLQKVALVIILTLIIIVAAVNMVSALTMMVTDKTREIAILKSMGGTSGSVAQVFQVVGVAIGAAGTLIGVGLGLVVCRVVSDYGYQLDPKVYTLDRLPVEVRPLEVLLVCGITMLVSAIATVVPASAASSLRPVDGLRYD